jgi:catechol 2,3-dioxygenase-like lactoylglutathione lyase family enzyme
MIQRMSHTTVWVLDQERALDFYVGKLGFEVRTDQNLGGFRWLTVGPKAQKELELILMKVATGPMVDEATAAGLRSLVEKGALGPGIFETDDCQKTYDELSAKGVSFRGPPRQMPYGIEAVLKDDSGNWFSVVQRPK